MIDASFLDRLPQLRKSTPPNLLTYHWFETDSVRIRYHDGGVKSARSVLLMPDPPNTIEHMIPLIRELSKDHRVIAFEGPGFGYSQAKKSFNFTIDGQADVILQLLDHLKANQTVLSLTCVGALSAIRAAMKRPEKFCGLVLAQVSSLDEEKKWAKRVDFKKLIGTPFIGQLTMHALTPFITRQWYKAALPRNHDLTSFLKPALDSFQNGARFSLASTFQKLRIEDGSNQLPLTIPAVILWGTDDRTHRRTNREAIKGILPNAAICELSQCGHFPDLERPMDYANEIRKLEKQV